MLEKYVSARSFKGFGEGRRGVGVGGEGGGAVGCCGGGRWEQLMVDDFPDTVRFLMGGVGWLSNGHDFM